MESPLFCSSCRRLYPAEGLSLFELLGVRASYDVDTPDVRRKYLELMQSIHPDRMTSGGAEVRRLSMRLSAQINQAFQVLLDPVLRAEYLLELAGGPSAADDKQVPRAVLEGTLELRQQIEEAEKNQDRSALDSVREQVQRRFDATLAEISGLARQLPGDEQTRADLRGKLNTIRYYRKLLEQL
jgi:molecular chaperone HscB